MPRYFVVEDVIWDAATTSYCHYDYDYGTDILFFILTFDEYPTQVYILFVGGMNLTSLSLSFCYCWFSRPILGKILVVKPF